MFVCIILLLPNVCFPCLQWYLIIIVFSRLFALRLTAFKINFQACSLQPSYYSALFNTIVAKRISHFNSTLFLFIGGHTIGKYLN